MSDIFGISSNVDRRFTKDHQELKKKVDIARGAGKKIAFVAGTFDVKHHGHDRYLEKGKNKTAELLNVDLNDVILVVGVDSDESVRERKGPGRPTYPIDQRAEQLCHCRHVDLVTVAHEQGPQWQIIKTIKPDTLVISKRVGATEEEKQEFKKYCQEVIELESQATTSTSAIMRKIIVYHLAEIMKIAERANEEMSNLLNLMKKLESGKEDKETEEKKQEK